MTGTLAADQVAAYGRDGFLFPLDVMSADDAARLRAQIEALERDHPDASLPRPLNQYVRVNAQLVIPFLADLARSPAVTGPVADILGPDLLAWSVELFIKEPGSAKVVSWHQDLTYWGMGETDEEITAWIAASDVSRASGCMRFVAGSHNQRIVPHTDTFDADNLLSRGQEIAVEVDENAAAFVELKPGQMSLHHGRMFHASGTNVSDDRRIGIAIRYVTPRVRPVVAARDYAMLVRGADRDGNWINVALPAAPFDEASLRLYEEVLAEQSGTLAEGADQTLGLYDAADAAVGADA